MAGGAAPSPLHWSCPEPQSPVAQEPRSEASKLQPVRAQKRPDHPVGATNVRDAPDASSNPVLSSCGLPEFDSTPGHTVPPHRFTNVNVVPSPAALPLTNACAHFFLFFMIHKTPRRIDLFFITLQRKKITSDKDEEKQPKTDGVNCAHFGVE